MNNIIYQTKLNIKKNTRILYTIFTIFIGIISYLVLTYGNDDCKRACIPAIIMVGLIIIIAIPAGSKQALKRIIDAENGNPEAIINLAINMTKYQTANAGKLSRFKRDEYGYRSGIFNKSNMETYNSQVDILRRYLSIEEFQKVIKENRIYDYKDTKANKIRNEIDKRTNNAIKITILSYISICIISYLIDPKIPMFAILMLVIWFFYALVWGIIIEKDDQRIIDLVNNGYL